MNAFLSTEFSVSAPDGSTFPALLPLSFAKPSIFPMILPQTSTSVSATAALSSSAFSVSPDTPAASSSSSEPAPVMHNGVPLPSPHLQVSQLQGSVARALAANKPVMDTLRATRKVSSAADLLALTSRGFSQAYEGVETYHRIVERCYGLMVMATGDLEFAGPYPGRVEEAKEPADEKPKAKKKDGKGKSKKK